MARSCAQWSSTHKLVLFLGLLSACLFISTLTLALCRASPTVEEDRGTASKLTSPNKVEIKNYRLPRDVIPKNYNLTLWPHTENGTFQGVVIISLQIIRPTRKIVLHSSNQIAINSLTLRGVNKTLITLSDIKPDATDKVHVVLNKVVSYGSYEMIISYAGPFNKKYVAFYSSTLKKGGMMVASKFEPTYAREAFPCFDEPDFKATYDITLVKPASYIALSNMPQISSVTDDSSGAVAVTFAKSVPMSTYLACFVICDFVSKEVVVNASGVGKNFVLRAFSQKGELQKIDFSLDIGKRATEFYIQYYEVPFPLPKLDMIAIPDYVSGATEHWGLITYRETSFLVDPAAAASSTKLSVANTVAHELAHMWFGNLVTMKWWNDLWLNEGFATYMQVKSLNALEPSWTMLDQFLTRTMHPVLVTDAKLSSHPIVQTVDTPDQITAIFDAISYNKGASVLRMVEGFVGEENFRQGVSAYLRKYEFGNTVTQDLLNVLEPYFQHNNPKLNLSYIMDTWTRQMGYPVLTVTAGDNPGVFVVKQSRFLLDSTAVYKNDTDYNYRWFVPITYKTSNKTYDDVLWFADSADHVKITLNGDESWLKINNNQVGYYRVNYPVDMWVKLIEQLKAKSPQLTISDRANLLNDAFALAEARHLPYPRALELATWLPHERDFVPWETAAKVFGGLASRLLHSTAYDDLQRYVQTLVKPIYQQQVWEEQDFGIIQGLLRARILSMACKYGLTSAEAAARGLFTKWLNSHDSGNSIAIEPDLRDLVYSEGMKVANKAEWEKMWHMYLNEKDVQEQRKLRTALSAPRDTTLLRGSDSEYEYDTEVVVSTPPPPPPQPKSQSARKKKPKIVPATVPEQLKRKAPSPSSESSAPTHSSTNRFLTLAWNESYVRSQDYLTVVGQISHNPSGTALVWDDVRGRWPELVQRFSLNSRYLGGLVPTITGTFNTQLKLHEMESFFEQYPDAGAGAGDRKRALETVRNNIQWSRDNEPAVAEWLKHFTEGA